LVGGLHHFVWMSCLYPGHKASGTWGWSPTSTCAIVKNEWICTCTPPICLQGVYRDSFTRYLYLYIVPLLSGRRGWRQHVSPFCIVSQPHISED
jgi:hypothetical protein